MSSTEICSTCGHVERQQSGSKGFGFDSPPAYVQAWFNCTFHSASPNPAMMGTWWIKYHMWVPQAAFNVFYSLLGEATIHSRLLIPFFWKGTYIQKLILTFRWILIIITVTINVTFDFSQSPHASTSMLSLPFTESLPLPSASYRYLFTES